MIDYLVEVFIQNTEIKFNTEDSMDIADDGEKYKEDLFYAA